MDAKPLLTNAEEAHARSIADENVVLAPIPPTHKPRILDGAVIRKPPEVIAAFLKTLAWQRLRKPADIGYHFVTDYPAGDASFAGVKALLTDFDKSRQNVTIRHATNAGNDFLEAPDGHHWTNTAWHRVGALKNSIMQACMDGRWDALWLVDADVLCDPYTLQSLGDCEVPIVAGVYWTHWRRPVDGDAIVNHAGPQVWLRHPYQLDGHGYTEADFRSALVGRKLLRVWGLGACTLFHRAVLEKGVSFAPVPDGLPPGPMSDGEDRHLCERARRLHLPLYADAWPDIWHAYHRADYDHIPRWLQRFASPRPNTPQASDLVSCKIESLEPTPSPQALNVLQHFGPQYVRGRLASLPVLPEIAEALGSMSVGERRIVRLHFPAHYGYATLRSQQRLVAVTLFDTKPWQLPPTIDEELFVGAASGKIADAVTLTPTQIDSFLEAQDAVAV